MDKRDIEIAELRSELEDMNKRFKDLGTDEAQHMKDQVKEYFGNASESMKENLDSAKKTATETGKQVQKYVKENPWHVAGMAAVVGFLLAMLTRGDRD